MATKTELESTITALNVKLAEQEASLAELNSIKAKLTAMTNRSRRRSSGVFKTSYSIVVNGTTMVVETLDDVVALADTVRNSIKESKEVFVNLGKLLKRSALIGIADLNDFLDEHETKASIERKFRQTDKYKDALKKEVEDDFNEYFKERFGEDFEL